VGLVYAAAGSVVDTTVVAGRVLMRHGVVEGTEEVLARTTERATRLGLLTREGAAVQSSSGAHRGQHVFAERLGGGRRPLAPAPEQ
jgi:hypothetical protein